MTEKIKYGVVSLFSIGAPFFSLWYSIFVSGNKDDAGRGGAVGAVLALGFLFVSRNYGARLYHIVSKDYEELDEWISQLSSGPPAPSDTKPLPSLEDLSLRIDALGAAIAFDSGDQKWQNRFLALCTAWGSLVWCFGDLFARQFIPQPLPLICHACICKVVRRAPSRSATFSGEDVAWADRINN